MTDYVLHDDKGNVVHRGSHAQVLQFLADQGQESRSDSIARHRANQSRDEIKRSIDTFVGACSEFNRVQDNFKRSLFDHAVLSEAYAKLSEQKFGTLYESTHARDAISVELSKEHHAFEGISAKLSETYDRVVAAVEKLDSFDAEDLRAADSRIAAVPRYAA
jgi:hypothetical protein